jgi:hypothetical protein
MDVSLATRFGGVFEAFLDSAEDCCCVVLGPSESKQPGRRRASPDDARLLVSRVASNCFDEHALALTIIQLDDFRMPTRGTPESATLHRREPRALQ